MKRIIVVAVFLFGLFTAYGQTEDFRLDNFNLKKKVGIQGYDPVAYFEQNKAIKGSSDIKASFKGVVYYFSSESNKQLFLKGASKYEPQYGGWCAYAMGDNGKKVGINPETYKIKDGKLYLFYNKFGTNTLKLWNEKELELLPSADKYWANIK